MKNIEKNELVTVIGGAITFSGAILNAVTGLAKYIYTLGQSFGSTLRRITSRKLCSCK